jgi:heat shock protein HslJ
MNRKASLKTGGWMAAVILLCLMALTGCGGRDEKAATPAPMTRSIAPEQGASVAVPVASENPLAGTEWRLLAIQSMDDSVGAARPDDPTNYTMRLNSDGTVNMRLNCNYANGRWSAKAGPDRASGSFEFGPLAATRALCPPPSLDERVVSQSQYVRSYLLKNGRLNLSLMADGGIHIWEPHPDVPFLTEPDKDLEAAILRAEPSYTKAMVDVRGDAGRGRYVYGRVDLNGDGQDEVFVYLLGSIFCGTGGCNLLLFTETRNGYSLVNEFTTTRIPVIISAEKSKGWNNIIWLKSGGGAESSYLSHVYNGKQYVEGKRMPADKAPEGKSYLVGELTFDKGISLAPRN